MCRDAAGPEVCSNLAPGVGECPNDYRPVEKKVAFGGLPGKLYSVTLRLRGVVEVKTYPGGTPAAGHVQLGGTPRPGPVNVYGFSVSAPDQTYYINADPSDQGPFVIPLDETVTVPIEGGAIVELFAVDTDCAQLRNCISPGPASCPPYVIPGVAPAPRPFVGQFAQVDVVSVVP